MQNKIMQAATTNQINPDLISLSSGDVVKIDWVISNEKGKERLQHFEGIVMTVKGQGVAKNVTVRKGIKEKGVEKTFPLNSPLLKKIEVISKGKIRKARPFYLRDLSAKALRTKLKLSNK